MCVCVCVCVCGVMSQLSSKLHRLEKLTAILLY